MSPLYLNIVLVSFCHNQTATSSKRLFDSIQPAGVSLLAAKLEDLLHDYLSALESAKNDAERGQHSALSQIKPIRYVILKDGIASK